MVDNCVPRWQLGSCSVTRPAKGVACETRGVACKTKQYHNNHYINNGIQLQLTYHFIIKFPEVESDRTPLLESKFWFHLIQGDIGGKVL